MGARRPAITLLLLVVAACAVTTAQSALVRPPDPVQLEQEARQIEAMLMAPCCFSQQVSEHQSPAADDARRDIRARLTAGQSRSQILQAYVDQHGARILAEPPATGFNLALYITPVVGFVATLGLLAFTIRRFSGRPRLDLAQAGGAPDAGSRPVVPRESSSAELAERLDDELRDLD